MAIPVKGAKDIPPERLDSIHSLTDRRLFLFVPRQHGLRLIQRHEYEGLSTPILWWDDGFRLQWHGFSAETGCVYIFQLPQTVSPSFAVQKSNFG